MSLTKASYAMVTGAPLNVMDYGAVGDGTTDDTAAINAAMTAAGVGLYSRSVFLPSGQYKVTNTITVPVGVTVSGNYGSIEHPTVILWAGNNAAADVINFTTGADFNENRRSISGIGIITAGSANLARAAIHANGDQVMVTGCAIQGNSKNFLFGILCNSRSFSFNLSDNYISECGVGMYLQHDDITGSLIQRNFVQNSYGGLVLIGPTGVVVQANSFEGTMSYRIVAGNSASFGASGLVITGNYLYGASGNVEGIICAKDITPELAAISVLTGGRLATAVNIAFTPSAQQFKAIHIHGNPIVEGPITLRDISAGDSLVHQNFLGSSAYPNNLTGQSVVLQDLMANNHNGDNATIAQKIRATVGNNLQTRATQMALFQCDQATNIKLATVTVSSSANKMVVVQVTGAGSDHFTAGITYLNCAAKFYANSTDQNVYINGTGAALLEIRNATTSAVVLTGAGTAAITLGQAYDVYLIPGVSEAYSGQVTAYGATSNVSYSVNTKATN
jgi:hypothetical protein